MLLFRGRLLYTAPHGHVPFTLPWLSSYCSCTGSIDTLIRFRATRSRQPQSSAHSYNKMKNTVIENSSGSCGCSRTQPHYLYRARGPKPKASDRRCDPHGHSHCYEAKPSRLRAALLHHGCGRGAKRTWFWRGSSFPSQACQVQFLKSCAYRNPGTIHACDADVLGAALSICILIWGSGPFIAKCLEPGRDAVSAPGTD